MSYTNKLTLRPLVCDDAVDRDILFSLIAQSLPQLQQWLSWARIWNGRGSVADYCEHVAETTAAGSQHVFMVETNGRPCGLVDLHDITESTAEVGYWVATKFWGRGIGTAATLEVLAEAHRYGINQLTILADEKNVASRHVALNAGFVQESSLTNRGGRQFITYIKLLK